MSTKNDTPKPALEMIKDLHKLDFDVARNPNHESNEELEDFVETYDVGFPVATLVSLGYIDFESLPSKTLNEIALTRGRRLRN